MIIYVSFFISETSSRQFQVISFKTHISAHSGKTFSDHNNFAFIILFKWYSWRCYEFSGNMQFSMSQCKYFIVIIVMILNRRAWRRVTKSTSWMVVAARIVLSPFLKTSPRAQATQVQFVLHVWLLQYGSTVDDSFLYQIFHNGNCGMRFMLITLYNWCKAVRAWIDTHTFLFLVNSLYIVRRKKCSYLARLYWNFTSKRKLFWN